MTGSSRHARWFGGRRGGGLAVPLPQTGEGFVQPRNGVHPPAEGATRAAARLRPAATLYLCCVVALAVGGGLLGIRLLQTGAANTPVHTGPSGLGMPVRTSFG